MMDATERRKMPSKTELLDRLTVSFPPCPLPERFFWTKYGTPPHGDIPDELLRVLLGRKWTDITIHDWAMVGTLPVIARRYLEPSTFIYYLPSLLAGASSGPQGLDFATASLIPDNHQHLPRGEWWTEFARSISSEQRATLLEFIAHWRMSSETDEVNRVHLEIAEHLWARPAA